MSWDFWATLRPESPRYADWLQVFGSEAQVGESGVQVPIASPIPEAVQLPIGRHAVLFLATDQLAPDQKARLIVHLAEKFAVDPDVVLNCVEHDPRTSVPLLIEDLLVSVLHPQRWLG